MIDTGTTPNYAASEKQLAQTAINIDRLETQLLELMDEKEAAEKEKKALEIEKKQATSAREKAVKTKAEREPKLRAEMAEVLAKRKALPMKCPSNIEAITRSCVARSA